MSRPHGYKHSLETIAKMKLTKNTGQYQKGQDHPNWQGGIPICLDCEAQVSHRRHIRCKDCDILRNKGENHGAWRGGLTALSNRIRSSKQYKDWRVRVKARDGYMCVWCGSKEELQADHIKSFNHFPELRFDIDNGRTLCFPCHRQTDTFGKQTLQTT